VFPHKDRDSDSSRSKSRGLVFQTALGRVFAAFLLLKARSPVHEGNIVSDGGYLIYGKALEIRPEAWRSLGVICAKTSRKSIIEIRHLEGSVFKTREAAEDNGLELCKNWLDKNLPSTKI
jgi:hypothetical protein